MTITSEQRTVWLTTRGTECETQDQALEKELEEVMADVFVNSRESYVEDDVQSYEEWWVHFLAKLIKDDELLVLIGRVFAIRSKRQVKIQIAGDGKLQKDGVSDSGAFCARTGEKRS